MADEHHHGVPRARAVRRSGPQRRPFEPQRVSASGAIHLFSMPLREGQPSVSSPAPAAAVQCGPTVEDADVFLARLEGLGQAALRPLPTEDAAALDALAVACARGGGAHELAVGEGLELLARGGDVRLGFSCIGDLARERLGLAAWQARRLRRNAVALRVRPVLRAAVESGEVSARKAEVVELKGKGRNHAARS